jgi:hypothetical protein
MSQDWIKMRSSLCTHPKVLGIAEIIGESLEVGKKLSTGFHGALHEIVTFDVTRDVTIASLMRVWCAANEHTVDGIWHNSSLRTIDQAAGIPGFGEAMVIVDWAEFDEKNYTVTLKNFLENNSPAKNGGRSKNAERQAKFREKKKLESNELNNVTSNVTDNVTVTPREEKRREELLRALSLPNGKEGENDVSPELFVQEDNPPDKKQNCPVQEIITAYIETLPNHPRPLKLTSARKSAIQARWRSDLTTVDDWRGYFRLVGESSFLSGKQIPTNGHTKTFIADIDWLIKESNMTKVIEGKYHS